MGYAVAEASLKSLARSVIIASSNKARVDSAVKRLTEGGFGSPGRVKGFVVDAASEESVKGLFENLGHHADPSSDADGVDHVVFTSGGPGERFVFPDVDIKAAKGSFFFRVGFMFCWFFLCFVVVYRGNGYESVGCRCGC